MKTGINIIYFISILFFWGCLNDKTIHKSPSDEKVYSFINSFINDELRINDTSRLCLYAFFDSNQVENEFLSLFHDKDLASTIFSDYDTVTLAKQLKNLEYQYNKISKKSIEIIVEQIDNEFVEFINHKNYENKPITLLSYPLITMDDKYTIIFIYTISWTNNNGEIIIYKYNDQNRLIDIAHTEVEM